MIPLTGIFPAQPLRPLQTRCSVLCLACYSVVICSLGGGPLTSNIFDKRTRMNSLLDNQTPACLLALFSWTLVDGCDASVVSAGLVGFLWQINLSIVSSPFSSKRPVAMQPVIAPVLLCLILNLRPRMSAASSHFSWFIISIQLGPHSPSLARENFCWYWFFIFIFTFDETLRRLRPLGQFPPSDPP